MQSLERTYRWTPKNIGLFAAAAYFIIIIFNQSTIKIRFLDWGLGALLFCFMLFFFLAKAKIVKLELIVIATPLLWMLYAFLCTPFAYNSAHHLSALFQALLLNLIASSCAIALFTRKKLAAKTVLLTVIAWTGVSFVLFVLWLGGQYTYENKDFAGLFNNRNAFAVQTVILIGMLFAFVPKHLFLKAVIVFFNFVLIVASLSTKGFLFFFMVLFYPLFLKVSLKRKILVIILGALLFGSAYMVLPNIQDRIGRFAMVFTSPEDLRQSESAFLRMWLMVEGFKLIKENPTVGIGVDNGRFLLVPPFMVERGDETGLYSHNNYIEMALNSGVVGLFLFYAPLLIIYFSTKREHPFFINIRTFIVLYFLMGIAMVQYNIFSTIFLYSTIVFLFIYHKDKVSYD